MSERQYSIDEIRDKFIKWNHIPESMRPSFPSWLEQQETEEQDCVCGNPLDDTRWHGTNVCYLKSSPPEIEKIGIHSSVNYHDPEEVLNILLDTQAKVNELVSAVNHLQAEVKALKEERR